MTKERPILMSAPMVRAILAGSKRQTRRIIKRPLPEYLTVSKGRIVVNPEKITTYLPLGVKELEKMLAPWKCRYGESGDRLWVRETFFEGYNDEFEPTGEYFYAATHDGCVFVMNDDGGPKVNKDGSDASPWKPSIHMPRKASRITLEITDVRAEYLQDISEDNAIAEGVLFNEEYSLYWDYEREQWICVDAVDSFRTLIDKISGSGTWDSNPLMQVVEFKVLTVKGDSDEH